MIRVTNLVKDYDGFTAVDNISFDVQDGEIFGVVGPNGAGKTTTFKMLSGLIEPTHGDIRINGMDMSTSAVEVKKILGFLPEDSPLYENMKVNDYLMFFAEIYGVPSKVARKRIDDLLFNLALPYSGKRIGNLSKGMRRKVAIARSLINDPSVLVYDEPASGLDPMTSNYITEFIKSLKGEGKTIIFSAHNLYQVESICDRVLIVHEGQIVAQGTMDEIRAQFGSVEYSVEFTCESTEGIGYEISAAGNGISRAVMSEMGDIDNIVKWVVSRGGDIKSIQTKESTLEEIFLKLVKTAKISNSRQTAATT